MSGFTSSLPNVKGQQLEKLFNTSFHAIYKPVTFRNQHFSGHCVLPFIWILGIPDSGPMYLLSFQCGKDSLFRRGVKTTVKAFQSICEHRDSALSEKHQKHLRKPSWDPFMDPLCRWTSASTKLFRIHGSLSPLHWVQKAEMTAPEKNCQSHPGVRPYIYVMDCSWIQHKCNCIIWASPAAETRSCCSVLAGYLHNTFHSSIKIRVKIQITEVKLELLLLMYKIIAFPHLGLLFYNLSKTKRLVRQMMDGHSFLSVFAAPHPHHTSCT